MTYKEISAKDYQKLQDTTGAYLILWPDGDKFWYLDGLRGFCDESYPCNIWIKEVNG